MLLLREQTDSENLQVKARSSTHQIEVERIDEKEKESKVILRGHKWGRIRRLKRLTRRSVHEKLWPRSSTRVTFWSVSRWPTVKLVVVAKCIVTEAKTINGRDDVRNTVHLKKKKTGKAITES